MRESIEVELDQSKQDGPTAFHVRFTHRDPEIAAKVTQELGTLFVLQNTRDRGALAEATNEFLEEQLAAARTKLESQEKRLEAFRQLHGKSLPSQTQSNLQALQSMQLQVQTLGESIARDRDRVDSLERLRREMSNDPQPQSSLTGSSADATPRTAREQLAAARSQLATLERRYKTDHPDVLRARRMVEELEPAAAQEDAAASNSSPFPSVALSTVDSARRDRLNQLSIEIEGLEREVSRKSAAEERVRSEIAEYQARVDAVPGLESQWVALTRDYDTQQAAYRELLSKSGNAKVAAALEEQQIGERFRIVDPARIPVHPLPSLRTKVSLGGLVLGLLLGLGVAGFLELRDASFRTEDEVLEILGLPVLAAVPRVETDRERRRRRHRVVLAGVCGASAFAAMGYVVWAQQLWKGLQ
jgi:polysaccharide chain length determinant protein (PEP-CTERM system associated)